MSPHKMGSALESPDGKHYGLIGTAKFYMLRPSELILEDLSDGSLTIAPRELIDKWVAVAKAKKTHACANCGAPIPASKKTCSDRCRMAWSRKKQKMMGREM